VARAQAGLVGGNVDRGIGQGEQALPGVQCGVEAPRRWLIECHVVGQRLDNAQSVLRSVLVEKLFPYFGIVEDLHVRRQASRSSTNSRCAKSPGAKEGRRPTSDRQPPPGLSLSRQ